MTSPRWRPMQATDLAAVQAIAGVVHVAHPEQPAVFAERLRLAPATCLVCRGESGPPLGYALAHPWDGSPPALDTLLGKLPATPRLLYIHDIALLEAARGRGAAAEIVALLAAQARRERLLQLALVAVNGTHVLWRRHGFRDTADATLSGKLATYGGDAVYMQRAL